MNVWLFQVRTKSSRYWARGPRSLLKPTGPLAEALDPHPVPPDFGGSGHFITPVFKPTVGEGIPVTAGSLQSPSVCTTEHSWWGVVISQTIRLVSQKRLTSEAGISLYISLSSSSGSNNWSGVSHHIPPPPVGAGLSGHF